MSLREKRNQMAALVSDWQTSGMSQREYAGLHNIRHRTLSYWISKQRQMNDSQSAFIQIQGTFSQDIRIRYPHGVEVILPAQTPAGLLRVLIQP